MAILRASLTGPMRPAILLGLAVLLLLASCRSTPEEEGAEASRDWEPEVAVGPEPAAPANETVDLDLDGFLKVLRRAAVERDIPLLASLMTPNFGYQLDPPLEGDGVFHYWDNNNLWGELVLILSDDFVSNGNFMVSPPEFADPSIPYDGYRAGVVKINGEWRFAYFVRG